MPQHLYFEPEAEKLPNTYGLPMLIGDAVPCFLYCTAIPKSKTMATHREVLAVERITSLPPVGASLPPFAS